MMKRNKRSLSVLTVALLAVAGQAFGASQIDFRPADDTIYFTSFGDFSAVANPFSLSYTGGTAEFAIPSGGFEKRTQGASWGGNFAPGDALLWTDGNAGPLTIEFSSGITAFATQIQANSFGTGTASISAYDASDSLLGTFGVSSSSTSSGDNSATLLGIATDPGDNPISRIQLNISGFPGSDFAINQVSLGTDEFTPIAGVPAPGAIALVGLGSGLVGWLRRRRAL